MLENRDKLPVTAIIATVGISVSWHVVTAIQNLFQHGCFMPSAIVVVLLFATGVHLALVCYRLPSDRAIGFDEGTKSLMWAVLPIAIPSGLSLYYQAVMPMSDGTTFFISMVSGAGNLLVTVVVPMSLRLQHDRFGQAPS